MLFYIILFMVETWKILKYIAYSYILIILGEIQSYSAGILIRITMAIYVNSIFFIVLILHIVIQKKMCMYPFIHSSFSNYIFLVTLILRYLACYYFLLFGIIIGIFSLYHFPIYCFIKAIVYILWPHYWIPLFFLIVLFLIDSLSFSNI